MFIVIVASCIVLLIFIFQFMVIKNNISHMDFEKFDINIKQKTIK